MYSDPPPRRWYKLLQTISVCAAPMGMVVEWFWSEIRYRNCLFAGGGSIIFERGVAIAIKQQQFFTPAAAQCNFIYFLCKRFFTFYFLADFGGWLATQSAGYDLQWGLKRT